MLKEPEMSYWCPRHRDQVGLSSQRTRRCSPVTTYLSAQLVERSAQSFLHFWKGDGKFRANCLWERFRLKLGRKSALPKREDKEIKDTTVKGNRVDLENSGVKGGHRPKRSKAHDAFVLKNANADGVEK